MARSYCFGGECAQLNWGVGNIATLGGQTEEQTETTPQMDETTRRTIQVEYRCCKILRQNSGARVLGQKSIWRGTDGWGEKDKSDGV
ncbi:hypothetical protein ACS0TY_010235 [Phlomoides rotata]